MSNCALNSENTELDNININDVRVDQFIQTIYGVLEGFDNGDYTIQTVASVISSACDKIADLFNDKRHVDCIVMSDYAFPLMTSDEAYMEFEKRVRFLLKEYKREEDKNHLYRNLVITCEDLEKNIEPKGHVKTLLNYMKKSDK